MLKDSRIDKLADTVVNYSLKVRPGERVLIECRGQEEALPLALIRAVYAANGIPILSLKNPVLDRAMAQGCTEEQLKLLFGLERAPLDAADCYVGIRAAQNSYEASGIPFEKQELYNNLYERKLLMEVRVPNTRWVVLRSPTPAMAQASGMSTEDFSDFYFSVCNIDYARMDRAMDPLKELMDRTDRVRIVARDTDLSFSIKGMGAVKCSGNCNIPDGEVYSAPVRDSVNGFIHYNTTSMMDGFNFSDIRLVFKGGKITEATANDSKRLNTLLDVDEGARYVGEFAIGVNPNVNRIMGDTLFDEKIGGSIHFTPGNCAMGCANGNRSQTHWDIVLIQTPEYGGGEIWFDDVLIRKDGRFVLPQLDVLNPENLR